MAASLGIGVPIDLVRSLERFVSPISAQALVRLALAKAERASNGTPSIAALLEQLEASTHMLVPAPEREMAVRAIRDAFARMRVAATIADGTRTGT